MRQENRGGKATEVLVAKEVVGGGTRGRRAGDKGKAITKKPKGIQRVFNPDGSIKATFTVDEVDTVAANNKTYSGMFDFKVFDPSGNQIMEVKGATAGTRITVD